MFKAIYEDTGKLPEPLTRRPVLPADCMRYLHAFRLASTSRPFSDGVPFPIPGTEIEVVLNALGLREPETRLKYLRLIRRMDDVELTHILEKRKK